MHVPGWVSQRGGWEGHTHSHVSWCVRKISSMTQRICDLRWCWRRVASGANFSTYRRQGERKRGWRGKKGSWHKLFLDLLVGVAEDASKSYLNVKEEETWEIEIKIRFFFKEHYSWQITAGVQQKREVIVVAKNCTSQKPDTEVKI